MSDKVPLTEFVKFGELTFDKGQPFLKGTITLPEHQYTELSFEVALTLDERDTLARVYASVRQRVAALFKEGE
jgi:hypothetical protein